MVKKIIACADIHIPSLRGIDDLKESLEKFMAECRKIVADEGGPENVRIAVAGDIFHNKITITNESIIAVGWFLKELGQICKTIICAGNHDFIMDNTDRIDSLTPLFEVGNIPNVVYLDKELGYKSGCYVDDNIVWCLFSSFNGFEAPSTAMVKAEQTENHPVYVGMIHGDINGAVTPTNHINENSLDPGIFKDCDFVIAGHIHKKQEIKKNGVKIVYCSSITQKNFGESISGHGYVLWNIEDPEDISYRYKELKNDDSGYYKFIINDISDLDEDLEELVNP